MGAGTFSIHAKRDMLPEVLELLRQVLREPALPAGEFEVAKRERLAMMEQMRTEPSALAPRRLQRELTPYAQENIRYLPTVEESIQRLQAVTHEKVTTLYREFLGSGGHSRAGGSLEGLEKTGFPPSAVMTEDCFF